MEWCPQCSAAAIEVRRSQRSRLPWFAAWADESGRVGGWAPRTRATAPGPRAGRSLAPSNGASDVPRFRGTWPHPLDLHPDSHLRHGSSRRTLCREGCRRRGQYHSGGLGDVTSVRLRVQGRRRDCRYGCLLPLATIHTTRPHQCPPTGAPSSNHQSLHRGRSRATSAPVHRIASEGRPTQPD